MEKALGYIRDGLSGAEDVKSVLDRIITMVEADGGEDQDAAAYCVNLMIRTGLNDVKRLIDDFCIQQMKAAETCLDGGAE